MTDTLRTLATAAVIAAVLGAGCSPVARSTGSTDSAAGASQTQDPSQAHAASSPASPPTPPPSTGTSHASPPEAFHTAVAFTPRVEFQAPAGWSSAEDSPQLYVLSGGPLAAIVLHRNPVIGTDEQECEGLAAPGASSTVEGLVESIATDRRLLSGEPQPVTIGGAVGQVMDIKLAPSWTATCKWSGGQPAALVLTVARPPGPFFGLVGRERARLAFLDVGDEVVMVAIDSVDGTDFDGLVARAEPILQTFRFTP